VNTRHRIVFLLLASVMIVSVYACGKKKPPFIPKTRFPFYVQLLKARIENGTVILKGYVIGPEAKKGENLPPVLGCRVYIASFGLDVPPCEGCPIEYRRYKEITGVVSGKNFECPLPDITEKGIYFFQVHLTGPGNAMGPPSDRAKLVINKDL